MPDSADYQHATLGQWRLVYLGGLWNQSTQRSVLEMVESQPRARHPQTLPLRLTIGTEEQELYVKVFHAGPGGAGWKDALRRSKALRAWRLGLALHKAGFAAPLTIAAGEQRRWWSLRRAFLVTQKVDGQPVHLFLRERFHRNDGTPLTAKWAGLRQAADLLRRFHRAGFVHGDLVATNLFVAAGNRGMSFYFMDNDRTRRYPSWVAQSLWKRNLVQLNRMPLPGITLQDRMRFFKAYLNIRKISPSERVLAHWLERRTRRRREECDGIDGSGDFRRLMRWPSGIYPPAQKDRDSGRIA
jgi:hypothetical protein